MQFTMPSWMERTQWRLLCHAIPECLPLYDALRKLSGQQLHQEECGEIAVLWEAAGKGVDEWERKRVSAARPSAQLKVGSHRVAPTQQDSHAFRVSDDALILLTVAYDSIVSHVDKATSYHFYPFSMAEGKGKPDQLVVELQQKAGFVRYTGQKFWENGVPLLGQVYIYGHCEPGVQKLQNDTETMILDSSQLAVRLAASGLQKEFSGRVKVFACHSGLSTHDDAGDEESMAESLANVMRARGYGACEYFGYTEALRYTNTVQQYTGHKYAFTETNPSYATSLRNPAYFEEVVKKSLWKVYAQQTKTKKMDRYDVVLQEMTIRDALEKTRNEESAKWYGANEQRASDVRVKV